MRRRKNDKGKCSFYSRGISRRFVIDFFLTFKGFA